MRKVLRGLVLLVAFSSLSAEATVLWQRSVHAVRTGRSLSEAEAAARMQLNAQLSSLQSQCQSQQGIALVFQLQKTFRKVDIFTWEYDFRVTLSCEN